MQIRPQLAKTISAPQQTDGKKEVEPIKESQTQWPPNGDDMENLKECDKEQLAEIAANSFLQLGLVLKAGLEDKVATSFMQLFEEPYDAINFVEEITTIRERLKEAIDLKV